MQSIFLGRIVMSLDKNMRFDSIQVLRAAAALLVVTEHIGFMRSGAFGVDIFFVISGFMIMYSTQESMKAFLRKRLIRILPLYWGLTIALFCVLSVAPGLFENTVASGTNLVKSLCFIPYMQNGVMQPMIRIGWTVNYEMFFYLIFWIAGHISHKYRGVITSACLVALVFGGGMILYKSDAFAFFCNPIILEFAFGILCYYIGCALYPKEYSKGVCGGCLIAAIVLLGLLVYSRDRVNLEVLGRVQHWGAAAVFVFLLFFFGGKYIHFPNVLVKLGDMSFSIYLIHYYVIRMAAKVCDMNVYSAKSAVVALLAVLVVLVLSYICWYFVENKFTKLVKRVMIKSM